MTARADTAEHSGPWTHGFATVNGVRLHYAEIGSGPLVLLLHGFPECWYMWRNVMPWLATRFHVVAPDLRGYNRSDKPAGVANYTLEKLSADVIGLIEELRVGDERAHLVGHDWGGVVAWYVGAYHPEHIDKLAVINAPHPGPYKRELKRIIQLFRSWYALFFQLPLFPEAVVRLTLRQALRGSAAVPGAFSDEALDVYEAGLSQPGAATAMINYYRAVLRVAPELVRGKQIINRPTLVIWGNKDAALSPRMPEGLDEWVPGVRVERVEESGHWVPEEKPRVVTDLLMGFLSRGDG
jgi:pimeloyl-ACP methyl ester carboxylesterase